MNKPEKCRETQIGRIVIHYGNIEKRVYMYELEQYLNKGWEKGISKTHRLNNSENHKGKQTWNKNTKGLMKPNKTTWQKGRTPWNKGIKGEQVAWNKGLTKEIDSRLHGPVRTEEERKKMSERTKANPPMRNLSPEKMKLKVERTNETKRKNGTFNSSKPENNYYLSLKEKYPTDTIIRQYKDKQRYPYQCDFYIKEKDLFIECNFHWTHGSRPYNPEDRECQKQLKTWQEKAKTSKFYQQAIYVWTDLDVRKRETAQKNKINIKILY